MVLETFLEKEALQKKTLIVFILGLVYVFVAYFGAKVFFGSTISIAIIFLITLLLVPSCIVLLKKEEKIESKQGLKNFFYNHKHIVTIYFFLFLSTFMGFLLLGSYNNFESVFEYQTNFLKEQEGLSANLIDNFLETEIQPNAQQFLALLSHNIFTLLLAFILAIFFGAGAIFLIILNASIFASFIIFVMNHLGKTLNQSLSILGIFSIHMLPEVAGFLLAAIAGGVLSQAVTSEKFGSKSFKNVVRDSTTLLYLAIILIIAAALLETYVTTRLIFSVI